MENQQEGSIEAGGFRRSARVLQFKENQGNVTKKDLTETQAKKERIKIECPIKDCPFSTDYAPPELATIQNQNHWNTKHQDDFLEEEVKRKKDEQDAYIAIEKEKHEQTKEWWLELEALELQKLTKIEKIKRGELEVKIDKDGKKVEEQVTPEKKPGSHWKLRSRRSTNKRNGRDTGRVQEKDR